MNRFQQGELVKVIDSDNSWYKRKGLIINAEYVNGSYFYEVQVGLMIQLIKECHLDKIAANKK